MFSARCFSLLLRRMRIPDQGKLRQFRPAVGSQAPNFKLRTAAGEEVELAAMKKKGSVVLLMLRGFL
jgi:hypothetical protein